MAQGIGRVTNESQQPASSAESFSPEAIARARECFAKARELVEKKNYDYAIEWYINGLEHWPEAVDEGHKPCRAAALFRGPKKVSFTDSMKYKTSGKDAKRAMLNAEMLLSKDPRNVGYMEAMFRNAAKAGYEATVMWIGEIFADAAAKEDKPNPARFALMREVYEELGDRHQQDNPALAIAALERAVEALSRLHALKPTDMDISTDLRDVAGKLTILRGRYSTADSFKDSIRDEDSQRDLHDRDRVVQADQRLDELIAKAESRVQADPTDRGAINDLVDLLCRRENSKEETKAIGVLVDAYKRTNEYRFKMRADDIRMKQLARQAREIAASGDARAAREHLKNQLRFELKVFKERVKQYPTELRMRYQYGIRLFKARMYDEAIPVLQEARNEPRTRFHCNLYVGRCFFEKGFYSQAADVFREAIDTYEMPDDELGKELHYWLGRAQEADGRIDDALKTYGQIIQWDYNYRKGDVRKRLENLKNRDRDTKPAGDE